ncbi:MAG: hypothetical protein L6422_06030 [Candidatus Marinimicrobia bacterium]|nr:hypothetical protein [Candidatus Neomarinimicrobiota bacterium]
MAILYRTHCRDRQLIQSHFYPFSHPDKIKGMIIGNDLDSLLSASLLKKLFDWDVVAIYDYRSLWYDADCSFKENLLSGNYVAVDLDIYHSNIPSLGHHVLEISTDDSLEKHRLSLNPNFIRGISCQNFRKKYPLGTIHFLLWLFEVPLTHDGEYLCWLADSSFINGQSHRFKSNVKEWVCDYFQYEPFIETLTMIDMREFEKQLTGRIIIPLRELGLESRSGQVRSRFNSICGFQYQWSDPEQERKIIQRLAKFIQKVTGWKNPRFPSSYGIRKGIRKTYPVQRINDQYKNLDHFLVENAVFSYALPYRDRINFTSFGKQ